MLLPLLLALAADTSPPAPRTTPLGVESSQQATASFVVHRQPTMPIVAVRLSLLANDPAGYAGAGHLIQHLALPALEGDVARVGGTVQMERSADAVVYTVTGPTIELPYLAESLIRALRTPAHTTAAVLSGNRTLREERLAEWETARQHVRAALRARIFPSDLSAAGSERSASRLTAASLPAVWTTMYRPERIMIVAVGDVQMADLERAFAQLPPRAATRTIPEVADSGSVAPLAPAQATRSWLGRGYLATDIDPAVLSLVARLLRDDLRRRIPTGEVEGEHWWSGHGQAVALVVSVPARDSAAARRAVDTAPATLLRELEERRVGLAAAALRREMLFYARTPDRMAEVVGQFADRKGDPDEAQRFYARLEEVEIEEVREALTYLVEHSPARVNLAPQSLEPAGDSMRHLSPLVTTALLLLSAGVVHAQERLAIRSEPGTPVVAIEVLLAAGPADEPVGKEGVAYLSARTVVAPIQATLDSLGAHLETSASKDALTFTLTAAPDVWEDASRVLFVALFRDPPERQWMVRQQTAIVAELASRAANPADAATRATDAAVFGEEHPWGRSTVGSAESIRRLTMPDVDAFLRGYVTSLRAVIAVVGPVDPAAARAHIRGFIEPNTALPRQQSPPPDPAEMLARVDYNSITTWIAVSYSFPADADIEALEFLARLTTDELSFSPSRTSVFNAESEVIPRRGGGELRLQVVSPPEEADRWADQVRDLVESTANQSTVGELHEIRLRRYRGERLLDLASPEARARFLARQLLVTGQARPLDLDVADMTPLRLRDAIRTLGPPTVVLLGPILEPDA